MKFKWIIIFIQTFPRLQQFNRKSNLNFLPDSKSLFKIQLLNFFFIDNLIKYEVIGNRYSSDVAHDVTELKI